MTDTTGRFTQLIAPDAEEIYEKLNYKGMDEGQDILFGPECEFFICKVENGELKPISCEEANKLIRIYKEQTGVTLHLEAIASHFELNYGPMNLRNFNEKFEDYFANIKDLYKIADENGYHVIPSSHAPHIKGAEEVIDQLVKRERIQLLVPIGRKYFGDGLPKFANLTAGVHVSSGYKDTEQFYNDLRRTYYLSPFIYALSNNGFPYWQGMKDAGGVIPRMAVIQDFANDPRGRTGIDPLFFEASDGEDFLKRYIDRIVHAAAVGFRKQRRSLAEIFAGRAEPGLRDMAELGGSPETPMSFADLEKHHLNTVSNYQFAASTWWYGVKVQDIPGTRSKDNAFPIKRLEDRIWNAGPWQLSSAILVRALMTLEPACGKEVDDLLERFGFHPEGPATHPESGHYLKQATEDAAWSGGVKGLDFAFGRGRAQDFGKEFTAILKKYAAKYELQQYLRPMEYITDTNETDARILAGICHSPEDVALFIEQYSIKHVPDPKACLGMLLRQGKLPALHAGDAAHIEEDDAPGYVRSMFFPDDNTPG